MNTASDSELIHPSAVPSERRDEEVEDLPPESGSKGELLLLVGLHKEVVEERQHPHENGYPLSEKLDRCWGPPPRRSLQHVTALKSELQVIYYHIGSEDTVKKATQDLYLHAGADLSSQFALW